MVSASKNKYLGLVLGGAVLFYSSHLWAQAESEGSISLLSMIVFAFVGGLILNLMPCVFPVLALKVFGFVRTAGEKKSTRILHVVAYSGGIVGTMVLFAAVIGAIRWSGGVVGWGFQFQNSSFIIFMCALLFLFALNLLSVFEIMIPGIQTGVQEEQSLGHSVFEGFLAVVLATPCSAPFVGTAVGFALSQGLFAIFLIFIVLGLGLACPFAVLALVPGMAERLPRPGNWMLRLKEILSFALLATMVWMLWILGQAAGGDQVVRTMILLLGLAVGAWAFGHWQKGNFGAKGFVITILCTVPITLFGQMQLPEGQAASVQTAAQPVGDDDIAWVKFSPEEVQATLKKGQPVFVDFTADWCITCKVNEKTIINTPEVRAVMDRLKFVAMKGDYTRADPVIAAALEEYGKGGVPMYLVYSPKKPERAEVLPEIFTKSLLNEALERAVD